jgi:hypothetical protein
MSDDGVQRETGRRVTVCIPIAGVGIIATALFQIQRIVGLRWLADNRAVPPRSASKIHLQWLVLNPIAGDAGVIQHSASLVSQQGNKRRGIACAPRIVAD